MTTENCLNELRSSIEDYPISNIVVWKTFVSITFPNGDIKEFETGIEMLEWLEKEYRDENGNLKLWN